MSDRELLRAAVLGQPMWGTWGSATEHRKYVEKLPGRLSRRRCSCGCGNRATHVGLANGVALTDGCELSMHRWAR